MKTGVHFSTSEAMEQSLPAPQVSLHSLGWPGICYVDQSGLELRDPPVQLWIISRLLLLFFLLLLLFWLFETRFLCAALAVLELTL